LVFVNLLPEPNTRLEKQKAAEMEESREETEKEPEGSNKKVSEIFLSDYSD
jgi:molecular chaperone GrpE (heat shock protein)